MSRMNNPMSRATKQDLKDARKGNLPATRDAAPVPAKADATLTKPTKEPKAPKEKAAPDATKITLAALSRELKKDPKTVRARMRRLYDQDTEKKLPQPVQGRQRWTFDVADRDALITLINAE